MNTNKALVAGAVGGVALAVYEFIMHGLIMGLAGGMLFAKTRSIWAEGAKGGMMFGFWLGLVMAFSAFYSPLTIEGFPYYLAWCSFGIILLGWVVYGAVAGLMYKTA